MCTEPRDGCLHIVSNSNWTPGTLHGAPVGALTSDFTVWMCIPQHHDRISMISASLPKSIYLLDAENGTFVLTLQGVAYTFNINTTPFVPPSTGYGYGNYDTTTLLAALNSGATCWSGGAGGAVVASSGTWYLGPYDKKFRYKLSSGTFAAGDGVTFSNRMGRYMGFDKSSTPYLGGATTTLVAQYMCQLTVSNVLHVLCDIVQQDVPTDKANCLGYIFTNETPFAAFTSVQNNPNPYEASRRLTTREQGTNIGSGNVYRLVRFTLVDDAGRTVNINGGHVMMDIFTYQRQTIYELVRRTAQSFADVSQEQRQVNLAQLETMRAVRAATTAVPRAESTSI